LGTIPASFFCAASGEEKMVNLQKKKENSNTQLPPSRTQKTIKDEPLRTINLPNKVLFCFCFVFVVS